MNTIHGILESVGELVVMDNWNQMQNIVNKDIGWENMTLYEPFTDTPGKRKNGHLQLDISDPRDGRSTYLGWKVGGKYVGFACIDLEVKDLLWVGDFEVFEKGKGYGRQFWEAISKKYHRKRAELCYHGINAKRFWTHMGFTLSHGCVMQKDL